MNGICPEQCGETRARDTALFLLSGVEPPTKEARESMNSCVKGVDPGAWFTWSPSAQPAAHVLKSEPPADAIMLLTNLDLEIRAWTEMSDYLGTTNRFGPQSAARIVLAWGKWLMTMSSRVKALEAWWNNTPNVKISKGNGGADIVSELQNVRAWPDPTYDTKSVWVARSCVVAALDTLLNAPIIVLSRVIFRLSSKMGIVKTPGSAHSALNESTLNQPTRFGTCASKSKNVEMAGTGMHIFSQTGADGESEPQFKTDELYKSLMGKAPPGPKVDQTAENAIMSTFMSDAMGAVAMNNTIPLPLAMIVVWNCPGLHMALVQKLIKQK